MGRFQKIARAVGASASAALAAFLQATAPSVPDAPGDDEDYAVARERLIQSITEVSKRASVGPATPGHYRFVAAQLNAKTPQDDVVQVEFQFVENDPHAIRLRFTHGNKVIKAITSRDAFIWALLGLPAERGTRLQATRAGETFHLQVNHPASEDHPPFKMVRFSTKAAFMFLAATAALVPVGEEATDWDAEAEHLGADPSQFGEPS